MNTNLPSECAFAYGDYVTAGSTVSRRVSELTRARLMSRGWE